VKKIGQVVNIDNNNAFIRVPRASSCGDNCQSCSSGCSEDGHIIKVKNNKYNLGEFVEITARAKNVVLYSILAYGLPLTIMIFTIVYTIYFLQLSETLGGLLGLSSLFGSHFIMKAIDKYLLNDTIITEDIRKI